MRRLLLPTLAAALLLGAGGSLLSQEAEAPEAQTPAAEPPAAEPGLTELQRLEVQSLSLQQQLLEAQIGLAQCQAQQQAARLIEEKSKAEAEVKKRVPDATIDWATGEITKGKKKPEQ